MPATPEMFVVSLAAVLFLGVLSQWIAWRVGVPSILVLLVVAFIAGPVTGLLDPDRLIGDRIFPIVSLSVAIILFEGGLNLKFTEIRAVGTAIGRLLTWGAFVTWVLAAGGAYVLLDMNPSLSVLFGAILVVTGPTVVIPMLATLRPRAHVAAVLKWEGIVIDPIGATLAVLVFETIVAGGIKTAPTLAILGLLKTLVFGGMFGVLGAVGLILPMRRYAVPDSLHIPATLTLVILAFAGANHVQTDSGFLAVTLMGIILANQKAIAIQHIIEFKETLRVLLIAVLFIVLGARFKASDLSVVDFGAVAFLAFLIVVVRPVAVWVSTFRSGFGAPEKLFLAAFAPRGIVAASVSAIFGFKLAAIGYPDAERLMPLTFTIIVGTVLIYGLFTPIIARALSISNPDPQGILIAGAHRPARAIAKALQAEGIYVVLVDTNLQNVQRARGEHLVAYHGNILSPTIADEIGLHGIGRLIAMTPNDEVNTLAAIGFERTFGRASVFQLASAVKETESGKSAQTGLHRRLLFGPGANYDSITKRMNEGGEVRRVKLTREFDWARLQSRAGKSMIPMFVVDNDEHAQIFTPDAALVPKS
ncbi:cation:proton antiporter, partial [bacterium]|nr:cation:proton antiporter [bacterium]